MVWNYKQLLKRVNKWNEEKKDCLTLNRTYRNNWKKWGNSRGVKLSLWDSDANLLASGNLQDVIDSLNDTQYKELVK